MSKIQVVISKIKLLSLHNSHVNRVKGLSVSSQPSFCRKMRDGEGIDGGDIRRFVFIFTVEGWRSSICRK